MDPHSFGFISAPPVQVETPIHPSVAEERARLFDERYQAAKRRMIDQICAGYDQVCTGYE
jgi:hypothetical protein